MQVKETLSEGLKREYEVVVSAADLDQRVNAKLNEIKDRVNIAGFRPGKVPLTHLKRVYGKSVMGEVIQQAVNESNQKIVSEGGFKLAVEPQITLAAEGEAEVKQLVEGKSDLAFKVAMEILPKIDFPDFKSIKITRPVAEVTDKDLDEALGQIADANKPYVEKNGPAADGDRVMIDFKGTVGGVAFDGGSAEDVPLVLGSGQFIPGFEEQLKGAAKGDERTVKVTFPAEYGAPDLAGKDAEFAVKVKAVEAPKLPEINDEFAKSLGAESLDKLKEQVRERIRRDFGSISRAKAKRALLDELDKALQFNAPASILDQEFGTIWKSVENDLQRTGKTFADEGTTEEEAREEYRRIADRRVRVGLAIAELGEKNNIQVSEDELTRALVEQARQFPGQEQQIWDHFRNNPQAMQGLRAPLFENKVIDFLLELVDVTDKKVTREELTKQDDDEDEAESGKAKKAAKKANAD
ncbi:MAG: trigger factor [Xanthobacteraceae bacterium]|nr:trigger factor [Xanthobacteraceae bacterium]QYK46497.1 MAG: trigger factor [Xanthobacteraceae bacterium]